MPPEGVLLGYKVDYSTPGSQTSRRGGGLEEHTGMLHLSSNEDDSELDGGLLEFHRSSKSPSPDLPGAEQDHFPLKLHKLLEQLEMEGKQHVLGWNPDGKSFSVFKPKEFASTIMVKYFPRQSKYKSFQRQLNLYAFKRENIGKIKGVYSHDLFVRDDRELCKMMKRERGPAVGLTGAAMVGTKHSSSSSASLSRHCSSGDMKASSEVKKAAAITGGLLVPLAGEIHGSSSWHRPQQDVGAAAAFAQGRRQNHSSSFPTITGNIGVSMGLGGNLFLSEQATAASLLPPIHIRGERGGAGGGPTNSSSSIARQHASFFPSRNTGTTTTFLQDEGVASRGPGVLLPPDLFQQEEEQEDQQDGSHPWPLSASNIGGAGDDVASTTSKVAEQHMTEIAAPIRHGSYPSITLAPTTRPPQQQHRVHPTSSSSSGKSRTQEHHGHGDTRSSLVQVLESRRPRRQEQEMDEDEEASSIGTIDGLDNLY